MIINRHLGDFTESKKSAYFWRLQVGYWVAYTFLQGILVWVLIAAGIIIRG